MPEMQRVIMHWTGGVGRASAKDREHYHLLCEFDGNVVMGKEEIEDNIVTADGDYAAHTLRLNTGSIGIAVCGGRGSKESPYEPGSAPITEAAVMAMVREVARLCVEYRIPVTERTVLTHAEVQGTLGVPQRGKWDIARLPFRRDLVGALLVGTYIRELVRAELGEVEVIPSDRPVLRYGSKGHAVAELQADLGAVGYFAGRIDGDYGRLTRAAVLAFQADHGLLSDGIVGQETWAALNRAEPRPPRDVVAEDLEETSGTIRDARMNARVGDFVGGTGLAAVAASIATARREVEAVVGPADEFLPVAVGWISENRPLVFVVVVAILAWVALRLISGMTVRRRIRDAREHRSIAR